MHYVQGVHCKQKLSDMHLVLNQSWHSGLGRNNHCEDDVTIMLSALASVIFMELHTVGKMASTHDLSPRWSLSSSKGPLLCHMKPQHKRSYKVITAVHDITKCYVGGLGGSCPTGGGGGGGGCCCSCCCCCITAGPAGTIWCGWYT